MTDDPLSAADIRAAAARQGYELDEETVETHQQIAAAHRTQWQTLEPATETSTTAAEPRLGEDPYNAFRYRFELDTRATGPLDGYDVGVKDNFAIAGVPMTCGSEAVEYVPDRTAVAIERLLDAGATVVGTTNMDEFAYGSRGEFCAHGKVRHPTDDTALPGGSSSGSAVAVATGMADVAIGSDSGGSIRIPASLSGVVGFKPSFGTVPRYGFVHLGPSIDHVGPLAATVEDAARVFSALTGPADDDLFSRCVPSIDVDIETVRNRAYDGTLGIIEELLHASASGVADHFIDVVETLAANGFAVESVSLPSIPDSWTALDCITAYEFAQYVLNDGVSLGSGNWYDAGFHEHLARACESGDIGNLAGEMLVVGGAALDSTDHSSYVAAQRVRRQLLQEVTDAFEEYDALLAPTTQITAPDPGEIDDAGVPRTLQNTAPFNLTGTPALSVPSGTVDGLPLGVQIITPMREDCRALCLGETVEHVLDSGD
jgi:Asp-tRNA(Asn)/Glu-tRNA(Gln) amidotransferase A subunit family amidase